MNGPTREGGGRRAGEFVAGGEFAGHLIVAELGRGGMGVVYRVHDPALDRDRAMKVIVPSLSADPRFRERFRRESRLAAQVDHPNAIPIFRAGEEAGQLFCVMRLVEGADLSSEVAAAGPLPPARAATIVSAVGAALDAAHAVGLVHRDVKPANVLLEPAAAGERVFLTDFGISRSETGTTITGSGEVMGSIDYVAPEQLEGGEIDRRADVYSLGCVAYFALTGEPPFPRDSDVAKMYAHVSAPRPRASARAPGLAGPVDDALAEALAVDPARRPPSAGEFAARLDAAVGGVHEAGTRRLRRRGAPAPRAGRGGRLAGRRAWLAVAVLLVAAVGGAVAIAASGGGGGTPAPSVVATIPVGAGADGIAVGRDHVWVAASRAGRVVEIDRRSNQQIGPPLPVGGHPSAVAVAFGSVWVTDSESGKVDRIQGHREVQSIRVGSRPADVVAANGWVWVANEGSNTVSRINPSSDPPRVTRTVDIGPGAGPHALAIGDGAVWVANIDGGTVSEINPRSALLVGRRPIPVGSGPSDIATGHDAVWVVDNGDGTLVRIDPRARTVSKPSRVGPRPRALKQGLGYLWVANGGDSTVWRVDQASADRVGDPIRVGGNPADLAIDAGSVWTANSDGGDVTRIKP